MAGNDCDAELRLGFGHPSGDSNTTRSRRVEVGSGSRAHHHHQQQQKKQITIFYNGQICVCDATEIQARAIISNAKQEMDNGRKKDVLQDQDHEEEQRHGEKPSPSRTPPPTAPQLLNPGLSMKRSLQRFLQKRKTRINASAPYHQITDGHPCSPCSTASSASLPLLCSNPTQ